MVVQGTVAVVVALSSATCNVYIILAHSICHHHNDKQYPTNILRGLGYLGRALSKNEFLQYKSHVSTTTIMILMRLQPQLPLALFPAL